MLKLIEIVFLLFLAFYNHECCCFLKELFNVHWGEDCCDDNFYGKLWWRAINAIDNLLTQLKYNILTLIQSDETFLFMRYWLFFFFCVLARFQSFLMLIDNVHRRRKWDAVGRWKITFCCLFIVRSHSHNQKISFSVLSFQDFCFFSFMCAILSLKFLSSWQSSDDLCFLYLWCYVIHLSFVRFGLHCLFLVFLRFIINDPKQSKQQWKTFSSFPPLDTLNFST